MDQLLDDPVFFEPFEEFFDPEIGRPSIPMETYLRRMFLRSRYRLGFEILRGGGQLPPRRAPIAGNLRKRRQK